MKLKQFKILLLLSLFAALFVQQAKAYSPKFADEEKTVRLRWRNAVIPVSVSASLLGGQNPSVKTDGGAAEAIRKSLDAWERAANVKFEIVPSSRNSVSQAGRAGDGVSLITIAQTAENLLLFGGDTEEIAARTRLFYDKRGKITEADIVLNPYQRFSVDGSLGTFDLEATLTHEIGHLLGLEHSSVPGATMFERQGKNGVYGLPNFSARTLSTDDIAGVRAVYGASGANVDCCGTINGKLLIAGARTTKDVRVWAEETETGRVAAAASTNADGNFRIEGLSAGKYSIYAQDLNLRKSAPQAAQAVGTTEVEKNKTVNFIGRTKFVAKTFEVQLVGFNSQLSELAVPLNGGKSFLIYVGGKNLDSENLSVGFSSPFFSAAPRALTRQDFGSEMSVLSFEVNVNSLAPTGDYSFFLRAKNGETSYLTGSLTVEDFVNPWSVFAFSADE